VLATPALPLNFRQNFGLICLFHVVRSESVMTLAKNQVEVDTHHVCQDELLAARGASSIT
jgi:hypothetical protein